MFYCHIWVFYSQITYCFTSGKKQHLHSRETQPTTASIPPLDIHPWMGCSVISHGLIQSAIPKSLATGHCTGEDRLSFIVTSISNWRLVIFMNLLVAQTSLFVRVRVRERACVHYVCNRATKWPIDSDIQSIISGPSLINGNSALQ